MARLCLSVTWFVAIYTICHTISGTAALRRKQPRIFGGSRVDIKDWPSLAVIRGNIPGAITLGGWDWSQLGYGGLSCGAIIISERWMVSAAHCYVNPRLPEWSNSPRFWMAFYGLADMWETMPGFPEKCEIDQIITHNKWTEEDKNSHEKHDIALIQLRYAINITRSRKVGAALLPIAAEGRFPPLNVDNCMAVGFGEERIVAPGAEKAARYANQLEKRVLPIRYCEEATDVSIRDRFAICTGYEVWNKNGSLFGDSGGPLYCKSQRDGEDVWVLAGVMSFGKAEHVLDGRYRYSPDVFTRVSTYVEWIQTKIGECATKTLLSNTGNEPSPPGN